MTPTDVAEWIRKARRAKEWTQQKLGDELGVSKANISHWETSKHEPSFLQLLKISQKTGLALPAVHSAPWPFGSIRREQLDGLTPDQLRLVEVGLAAALAAARSESPAPQLPVIHHTTPVQVTSPPTVKSFRPPPLPNAAPASRPAGHSQPDARSGSPATPTGVDEPR